MRCSVDPFGVGGSVDHLEGNTSALVEHTLGSEALVLVISVGGHASTESVEVLRALLLEDVLARGALIFSGEAVEGKLKDWK